MIIFWFFIFVIGAVFGSFFNVLIYRIPIKKSIIFPASFCPNCKKPIKWYDNLPIISYLILKGRCRYCKEKISLFYPIVETITGFLFLIVFWKTGINILSLVYIIIFSSLLVNSFIDLKTKNIYISLFIFPSLLYVLYALFIEFNIFSNFWLFPSTYISLKESITGFLTGAIFFFIIRFFGGKILKKEGMGEGDIYVAAFIGLFIGFPYIFFVFIFAGIFGIIFYYTYYKDKDDKVIPFVPFLSLSSFFIFLILDFIKRLYL